MNRNINIKQEFRVDPTLDMTKVMQYAYDPQKTKIFLNGLDIFGFYVDHKLEVCENCIILRLQGTSPCVKEIKKHVGKVDVPLILKVHAGGDEFNEFHYLVKIKDVYPESIGNYVPVVCVVLKRRDSKGAY